MAEHVVFALGADRAGIVAAVTESIAGVGANLLDCSMTVLSGHFAVVLVVDCPPGADVAALEAALAPAAADLDLTISVRAIGAVPVAPGGGARHMLSVYGADRPGIVARVARALAERGVNITDLETRLVGGSSGAPLYAMLLEVEAPAVAGTEALQADLRNALADLDVDVSLHPVDEQIL